MAACPPDGRRAEGLAIGRGHLLVTGHLYVVSNLGQLRCCTFGGEIRRVKMQRASAP